MALRCHHHTHSASKRRTCQGMTNSNPTLSRPRTVQELLQLVEGTDRGLNTPAQVQASILSNVEALKAESGSETTSDQVLSATWKVSCIVRGMTLYIL